MAWELKRVEDQRKELVKAYDEGQAMTELSKRFGVSRKTAYKWYHRYLEHGLEKGLADRSRAPLSPKILYTEDLINIAIDLKVKYRSWGPKKNSS